MAKEKMEKDLHEVTEKGLALINALKELGDEVDLGKVSDHMGISKAAVTGSMNSLVKRGIAQREEVISQNETTGKDEIKKYLQLTDFGKNETFYVAEVKPKKTEETEA